MLYITTRISVPAKPSASSTTRDEVTPWHIGESTKVTYCDVIVAVQADGEELDYIRNNFSNLPMREGHHAVVWEGELATFIARNL